MTIVRLLPKTFFIASTVLVLTSCGKNDDGEKDKNGSSDDANPASANAAAFVGIYTITKHQKSGYKECTTQKDVERGSYDALKPYLQLKTTSLASMKLMGSNCASKEGCADNYHFAFSDFADGKFSGVPMYAMTDSSKGPDKCSYSYYVNEASLTGNELKIVYTKYTGDVAKIGDVCTGKGKTDWDGYKAANFGKLPCYNLQTITATK